MINMKYKFLLPLLITFAFMQGFAQSRTWVDSMELYSKEVLMPPHKYAWTWQSAALLRTMIARYEQAPTNEKASYLEYVRKSMDHVKLMVNGRNPNNVAS